MGFFQLWGMFFRSWFQIRCALNLCPYKVDANSMAARDFIFERCTICGEVTCDCWIELRCPRCDRTKTTEREPNDPASAWMTCVCPTCSLPQGMKESEAP